MPKRIVTASASGVSLACNSRSSSNISRLHSTNNREATLRSDATYRQDSAACSSTERLTKHRTVSSEHGKVFAHEFDRFSQSIQVSRTVFDADYIFVFTQARRGFGFNLDSGECRHAVKNHRHWRRIGNASGNGRSGPAA